MLRYGAVIIAAMGLCILPATSNYALVQSKKDVLGFYTGMPGEEFDKNLQLISKGDCTPLWNSSSCNLKLGKLSFHFTDQNLLRDVTYVFKSGTDPEQIIEQITKEYGVKPVARDHKKAIAYARSLRTVRVPLLGTMFESGGDIAEWSLMNQDILRLHLFVKIGNEYTLTLLGTKLIEAESAAEKRKRDEKERERKNVNPTPRF